MNMDVLKKDQACLGTETLPTNKRESIGMVKPSDGKHKDMMI